MRSREKARVHVTIEANAEETLPAKDDDDPTGWKAAREFIGMWKDAPTDIAENRDK